MGLSDVLQGNLDAIAGKVGMTPDQVKNITDTLHDLTGSFWTKRFVRN